MGANRRGGKTQHLSTPLDLWQEIKFEKKDNLPMILKKVKLFLRLTN
jgi:hypothetical protein